MNPFNVTQKVLGPYLFSTTARETLGEKMEYYFHDHSFVPLFIFVRFLLLSFLRQFSRATADTGTIGELHSWDAS